MFEGVDLSAANLNFEIQKLRILDLYHRGRGRGRGRDGPHAW